MEQGHEGRRTLVVGKVSIRHVLLVYFADPMDLAQDDHIVELVVDGKADVREAGSLILLTIQVPPLSSSDPTKQAILLKYPKCLFTDLPFYG